MQKLTGINYEITNGSGAIKPDLRIIADYERLIEVFGEPTHVGSGDRKTQLEWVFHDGLASIACTKVLTVYDWKTYPRNFMDVKEWHVGARGITAEEAKKFFIDEGLEEHELESPNFKLPENVQINFERVV